MGQGAVSHGQCHNAGRRCDARNPSLRRGAICVWRGRPIARRRLVADWAGAETQAEQGGEGLWRPGGGWRVCAHRAASCALAVSVTWSI
eukprot:4639268-Prymnesium_polylepis.1